MLREELRRVYDKMSMLKNDDGDDGEEEEEEAVDEEQEEQPQQKHVFDFDYMNEFRFWFDFGYCSLPPPLSSRLCH